jgi:hypothetical protein
MPQFWTDTYLQHFQHYFQKPFDNQVYHDPGGSALKVATYDWARHGFRVYASMGLADKLLQNEETAFGEVILFSDVADREIPQLFVHALFFILQHNIPLKPPFAIGIGAMAGAFTRRYGKNALYFSGPADHDPTFGAVHQSEAVGQVFQAFFITPEEDKFLEEHGPDAFEAKFRQQFGAALTAEERCDLAVDKAKMQQLQARLAALHDQANRALSIRRPSCV